jgi:antitoxin VapB
LPDAPLSQINVQESGQKSQMIDLHLSNSSGITMYILVRILMKEALPMPQYARVFQSGNSQAIRLPKEFRFDVDQVEVTREGDAVILRPRVDHRERWASLRAALQLGVSEDFMAEGRQQPKDQDRPNLENLFE